MKAYSLDLRRKIVETYEAGGITQRELAKRFVVSLYFVIKLLRRWRHDQTFEAKRRGGTMKPLLTPEIMQFLAARLTHNCDLSLVELCDLVAEQFLVRVSPKTMSRMLLREGLNRKKCDHAAERDTPRVASERERWRDEQQPQLSGRRVVFVDETGVNLRMARRYGRARRRQRAHGRVPKNYGAGVTVVGAMDASGVVASMSFRGAMETLAMREFVRQGLLPELRAGDCVVWDNLAVHKTKAVRVMFEQAGVELLFLPAYSPDLNPIEQCWSKVKTVLRTGAARTYGLLDAGISAAIKRVTASDARNWIRHCGYVLQSP